MRKAMSGMMLGMALVVGGAAQAQQPVDTAQQASYFGSDFMAVVNKDTAYPHAGLTRVKLDVYFFDPSSLWTPGTRVDYIRYDAVVDCSHKGAWTSPSWAGYREGSSKPVLTGADREGTWRSDAEGSFGLANWNAICRDEYDSNDVTFPRSLSAAEVLKKYRWLVMHAN